MVVNTSDYMTGLKGPRVSLLLAALVLMVTAAIFAATVLSTPAGAQDPSGAISNLNVSSPDAGQSLNSAVANWTVRRHSWVESRAYGGGMDV